MPRGPEIADFAEKLRLSLARANVSRAQLARAVGVDKSVVARWLNGALHPSDHTLTVLTAELGRTIPAFTRAEWDTSITTMAARLGVPQAPAQAAAPERPRPDDPIATALARMHGSLDAAASTYGGLWVFVMAKVGMQVGAAGEVGLLCSVGRIRPAPDGSRLAVGIGGGTSDGSQGVALVLRGDLNLVLTTQRFMDLAMTYVIFGGISAGRAAVLDGIALSTSSFGDLAQMTYRVIGFRLGDAPDDACFAAMVARSRALNNGALDHSLPMTVTGAFTEPVMTTPSPSRTRLPRAASWSCAEESLADAANAAQREALDAVRGLFADARNAAAPA